MQENMDEIIDFIAESIKSMNRQALLIYKPIEEDICSGRTLGVKEIKNVVFN